MCTCRPCCVSFPVCVDAQQAAVPQADGGGVCCCGGHLWQHGHYGVSEQLPQFACCQAALVPMFLMLRAGWVTMLLACIINSRDQLMHSLSTRAVSACLCCLCCQVSYVWLRRERQHHLGHAGKAGVLQQHAVFACLPALLNQQVPIRPGQDAAHRGVCLLCLVCRTHLQTPLQPLSPCGS